MDQLTELQAQLAAQAQALAAQAQALVEARAEIAKRNSELEILRAQLEPADPLADIKRAIQKKRNRSEIVTSMAGEFTLALQKAEETSQWFQHNTHQTLSEFDRTAGLSTTTSANQTLEMPDNTPKQTFGAGPESGTDNTEAALLMSTPMPKHSLPPFAFSFADGEQQVDASTRKNLGETRAILAVAALTPSLSRSSVESSDEGAEGSKTLRVSSAASSEDQAADPIDFARKNFDDTRIVRPAVAAAADSTRSLSDASEEEIAAGGQMAGAESTTPFLFSEDPRIAELAAAPRGDLGVPTLTVMSPHETVRVVSRDVISRTPPPVDSPSKLSNLPTNKYYSGNKRGNK
jgi:uncharacterized coiled-coil protein SlyX